MLARLTRCLLEVMGERGRGVVAIGFGSRCYRRQMGPGATTCGLISMTILCRRRPGAMGRCNSAGTKASSLSSARSCCHSFQHTIVPTTGTTNRLSKQAKMKSIATTLVAVAAMASSVMGQLRQSKPFYRTAPIPPCNDDLC